MPRRPLTPPGLLPGFIGDLTAAVADVFRRAGRLPHPPGTAPRSPDPLLPPPAPDPTMATTPGSADADPAALLRDFFTDLRTLADKYLARVGAAGSDDLTFTGDAATAASQSSPEPDPNDDFEPFEFPGAAPAPPPVKATAPARSAAAPARSAAAPARSAAAPARSAPPVPGQCRLATDLAAAAAGEPWADALAPLGASPADAKLTKAVRDLLLKPPGRISSDVARVLAAWADATTQDTVRSVAVAEVTDRKSVAVRVRAAFAEVPGLQVEGKLVHPPKLDVTNTPAGNIAGYAWQHTETAAADIIALASGTGAPSFEFLRQVVAWADQPDHPVAAYARELVATGLASVQTVAVPGSPNDPRFEVVRKLYRNGFDGVLWTLSPALVHADSGNELRRGRVEAGAGKNRPPAEAFMVEEAGALVDELRSRPEWAFEYADGIVLVPCRAEDVRNRFDGRLRDIAAAKTAADGGFAAATSFAKFVQDVLRVVLTRGATDAATTTWRNRQDRFKMAIKEYLPEFGLKEEVATTGQHYGRYSSHFDCIKNPAARSDIGRKAGEVVSTIAPRLVYEAMGSGVNGALFYWAG